MPEQDVCSQLPVLMQYLNSGNLVFYGAADIGKSNVVEKEDDVQQIEQLADLDNPVAEYVALDDIYCLYQEYRSSTDQDLKNSFEELLSRDYGVCLVTRPRSLDWLLTNTDFPELMDTAEYTFLARQFNENETVETATQLVSDLSNEEIRTNISEIEYTYTFEEDSLEDYSTYVPYILLRSSALGNSGGIFPGTLHDLSEDGVLTSLRGFAGRFSESIGFSSLSDMSPPSTDEIAAAGSDAQEFLQDYEQVYQDIIQPFLEQNQDTIQAATASVVSGLGASAAPIVGPLLIGALLRPDGTAQSRDASADFFGELLADELYPTSRCKLEEEMGVPPMTLEYLRTITRPEFHSQITQLLEADIDHLENIATQAQSEIADLENDLEQLSDRVTVIEGFISARMQAAVKPQDALRSDLEALEQQYLQISGSIPIENLELQNVDLDQRYGNVLTGSKVQVLRGPHGTGKTTLSYRLCQRFTADGYTVRLPQFSQESRSFIKTAFEAVQTPLVVFTSYRVGAFATDDESQIYFLLELVDQGIIDKLLIECRDEVYGQLNDGIQARTSNERLESKKAELWKFKQVFELPEIEEEGIRAIATWVGNTKGELETVQEQLSKIIDVAGRNPEIGKIAARMVCDGQDLSDIQTEDQLIWHDIQNLTSARTDQIETAQRTIIKWLSVSRGLQRDELKQLTDIRRGILEEALENLSRYWQTTDNGIHQLIPDVYQEIIFREECLGELDYYVSELVGEGIYSSLSDVALNITICVNVSQRDSYPGLEQRCLDDAEIVLSNIIEEVGDAQLYHQSIKTLTNTDLLLPIQTVEANLLVNGIVSQIDEEANSAYMRGRKVHSTQRPEVLSLEILSSLTGNYVLAEEYDEVGDLVEIMIETFRLHQQVSPGSSSMLHYYGETEYQQEIQYIMGCVGMSFKRIAPRQEIDDLVANSETVLDTLLSHQGRDLQYPVPDPSEESRILQTTVIFYSRVINGIANEINEREVIDSLILSVHEQLSQAFNDVERDGTPLQMFSEEAWLVRADALFIKSLMYNHRYGLVDCWPEAIELHVNNTFEPEEQCNFYKYIVEWAATRAEMEPRPGWLIWILSHEGILSIAADDDLDFVQFDNGYMLIRLFFSACLGVITSVDLPRDSAKLNDLLEARTDEMDGRYSEIYQAVVKDLREIDERFHR